ncbi:hypothetical protein LXL04_009305 [Taraxacum kok-saghyz]
MDQDAARTARESLELVFQMSNIVDTGLDRHTLSVLIALCDLGLNPEALAAVVKEFRRDPPLTTTTPPSSSQGQGYNRENIQKSHFQFSSNIISPYHFNLTLLSLSCNGIHMIVGIASYAYAYRISDIIGSKHMHRNKISLLHNPIDSSKHSAMQKKTACWPICIAAFRYSFPFKLHFAPIIFTCYGYGRHMLSLKPFATDVASDVGLGPSPWSGPRRLIGDVGLRPSPWSESESESDASKHTLKHGDVN